MNDLPMLVPALAQVLVDFLWQGVLIGGIARLALTPLRNARPQVRYAVACVALLACVVVPAWQLVHVVVTSAPAPQSAVLIAGENANVAALHDFAVVGFKSLRWLPSLPDGVLSWIVPVWAAGAGALTLRMACGLWWVRRLRMNSVVDPNGWQQRLDSLAQRMGIRRSIALRIIPDGDSPLSAGWWRPVVLLPASLALRMPSHLLEALVAHELAHVRRHDYLVNLLQSVVEVMLFYHPVTWWLSRRIHVEREQVADDIAASALCAPRRLALALSQLDSYAIPVPLVAQAAHGGELSSRIQRLVRPTDHRAVGGTTVFSLLALLAVSLVFAQTHSTPVAPTPSFAPAARVAPPVPALIPRLVTSVATTTTHVAARPTLLAAQRPTDTRSGIATNGLDRGFARIPTNREGLPKPGEPADIHTMNATSFRIDSDSISIHRDGRHYVILDAALVSRTRAAWAPTRQLESRMEAALGKRTNPQQDNLEALSKQMEATEIVAKSEIQKLIEEAVSRGLVVAVPARG